MKHSLFRAEGAKIFGVQNRLINPPPFVCALSSNKGGGVIKLNTTDGQVSAAKRQKIQVECIFQMHR